MKKLALALCLFSILCYAPIVDDQDFLGGREITLVTGDRSFTRHILVVKKMKSYYFVQFSDDNRDTLAEGGYKFSNEAFEKLKNLFKNKDSLHWVNHLERNQLKKPDTVYFKPGDPNESGYEFTVRSSKVRVRSPQKFEPKEFQPDPKNLEASLKQQMFSIETKKGRFIPVYVVGQDEDGKLKLLPKEHFRKYLKRFSDPLAEPCKLYRADPAVIKKDTIPERYLKNETQLVDELAETPGQNSLQRYLPLAMTELNETHSCEGHIMRVIGSIPVISK